MGHTIEPAKSGRASCKTCRSKIEKGELRLGEEAPNPYAEGEMGYRWHHLECGAKKKQDVLREALEATDGLVPKEQKEKLEKLMDSAQKTPEKAVRSPYADYAKTGRSSCIECKVKIEKGDLRVSVYIEPEEMGGFGRKGFVHPGCTANYNKGSNDEMMKEIRENSTSMTEDDYAKLEGMLVG